MGLWQPLARHGPHPRPPLAGRPRRLIRKLVAQPPHPRRPPQHRRTATASLLPPFTNRNSASHPNLDIYISSSRGAYLGIDLRYTHFNEQLLTAGTPGREGDLISAGILLGYSFALDPCGRWAIDAALALGYQYQDYDRYTWYAPAAQNRLLGTRTHNRFTLTALDVALVYRF